jgi:tetratricopeptide (TPR) repeat protein
MPSPTVKAKGAAKGKGRLEFFVDARLELDGVMELLAADGDASKAAKDAMFPDIAYVRAAKKHFAAFKDHPAVKHRREPSFRTFDMGQRGQALMRLSALPELKPETQLSISFLGRFVGGDEGLERWLQGMRDFARDAKFLEFFEANKGLLDADLKRVRAEIEEVDYVGKIEAYTKLPFEGRYAFVLTPFVQSDTGANVVQRGDDGLPDIISVLGPIELPPAGGPMTCTYMRLHPRVWHEVAHGVLDNVTELYGEEIALKAPPKREPTPEYQNWMHHVREHMVRSVMLRLVAQEISASFSDDVLHHEEECGLPFLREFKKRIIDEYESGAKYATFADFYPRLIDLFPAQKTKAQPLERDSDPYRDWITEHAMPFYTEPQRRRALWYLDLMLATAPRPSLRLKRACLLSLLGEAERAKKDAAEVLKERPNDEGALLVQKSAGQPRAPQGEPSRAAPGHENAYRRPPELARLNAEGIKVFVKGEHKAALKSFEAALKLAPEDHESLVNAAVAYTELKQDAKALTTFAKAIDLCLAVPSPQSRTTAAIALSSRASLHKRAKRTAEARADLQKALQLAPPEWDKRSATEKLLKELG